MKEKIADEMFKELGYVSEEYHDIIMYGKKEEISSKTTVTTLITFSKARKEVEINPHSVAHYIVFSAVINIDLHKAITKKMEELGWL